MKSTANAFRLAACLFFVGCGWQDAKPRGAGASGRTLAVLAQPKHDLDRFFKYTPEQERVMELMQQPFDAVAKPGPAANDGVAKAMTEKVKSNWEEIRYLFPKDGRYQRYRIVLATTASDLVVDTFERFNPNLVRNLAASAKSGVFNNMPIAVEDGRLVFGAPLDRQAYTLPARAIPTPLPRYTVFAFLTPDGRASGERFGISTKLVPGGGAKVSMFGHLGNASNEGALQAIIAADAKKPGSVLVREARVETFEYSIFDGAEPRIPKLDKNGDLEVPEIALFTGGSGSEFPVDPMTATLRGGGGDGTGWIDSLLGDLLRKPNIPPFNPNQPPPQESPARQ